MAAVEDDALWGVEVRRGEAGAAAGEDYDGYYGWDGDAYGAEEEAYVGAEDFGSAAEAEGDSEESGGG